MTFEELKKIFDDFKSEGYEEEEILEILYLMYADGKIPLEDLRMMTEVLGYEFTEEFEAMSEEDKKKKGLKHIEEAGEGIDYEFTEEFETRSEDDKKKKGLKYIEEAGEGIDYEEVTIIGPSIKNTCWQCYNAMSWALRNNTNCAKYAKKPYEVYFEGADCPYFDKVDKLPGQPESNC